MLTDQDRKQQAVALKRNKLLTETLAELEADTITAWRRETNQEQREAHWHLLRAIDKVTGVIDGAIRKHAGDD